MNLIRKFLALFAAAPAEALPIRYLGDMQRLQAQPGDIFILMFDRSLNEEEIIRVRASVKSLVGEAKVLVLTDGARLGFVSLPGRTDVDVNVSTRGTIDPAAVREHLRRTYGASRHA